jgi:hypothetical protein
LIEVIYIVAWFVVRNLDLILRGRWRAFVHPRLFAQCVTPLVKMGRIWRFAHLRRRHHPHVTEETTANLLFFRKKTSASKRSVGWQVTPTSVEGGRTLYRSDLTRGGRRVGEIGDALLVTRFVVLDRLLIDRPIAAGAIGHNSSTPVSTLTDDTSDNTVASFFS